jgi:hypothetical protein
MQAATALRVGLPGLPDGQEIEPDAEIGIDDDEALAALPALRQAAAGEQGVADEGRVDGLLFFHTVNENGELPMTVPRGCAGRAITPGASTGRG